MRPATFAPAALLTGIVVELVLLVSVAVLLVLGAGVAGAVALGQLRVFKGVVVSFEVFLTSQHCSCRIEYIVLYVCVYVCVCVRDCHSAVS